VSEDPANSKSADTSFSLGDAVVNWDRIIYKNVRTLDNQGMGKVIAVPNDFSSFCRYPYLSEPHQSRERVATTVYDR
jgi:hypothetical protein